MGKTINNTTFGDSFERIYSMQNRPTVMKSLNGEDASVK